LRRFGSPQGTLADRLPLAARFRYIWRRVPHRRRRLHACLIGFSTVERGNDKLWIVGLGEVLWDCFSGKKAPGGAPANVAYHAQQLGCRGAVCSRVGTDDLGDELLAFLQQQGLVDHYVQRDDQHPTSTVTVDDSRPDDPRYTIHEDVAWDNLAFDEAIEGLMARAAAVCFGTLAQRRVTSRRTIGAALERAGSGCLIIYDVNLRQKYYDREVVEHSLHRSALVKLNDEEVEVLRELLDLGPIGPVDFAQQIADRYDLSAVCITRGDEGCMIVEAGEVVDMPGVQVQVADTVGAGDAFTAAWIVSRLGGWTLRRQAEYANRVGALVASCPGAMPPLGDEFAQLAAEIE
jgi:fructokinase